MKIRLDGYVGTPENQVFYFEDEQSIELCSTLRLDEVSVVFATPTQKKVVNVKNANGVQIPIPNEMLKADNIISIAVDLMYGGKIARRWDVKPFVLTAHESGLEAQTFDFIKEVQDLKLGMESLQKQINLQQEEIKTLKQRINPIKDVL